MVDLSIAKMWTGTAMVDLTIAKMWNGTAFVDLLLPGGGGGNHSVTVSPGSASAFFIGDGRPFEPLTTNSVTATSTGGVAPYSGSWIRVSGSSAVLPVNPTSPTTAFTSNVPRDSIRSAVYKWEATDSAAQVAFGTVSVSLRYEYEPQGV